MFGCAGPCFVCSEFGLGREQKLPAVSSMCIVLGVGVNVWRCVSMGVVCGCVFCVVDVLDMGAFGVWGCVGGVRVWGCERIPWRIGLYVVVLLCPCWSMYGLGCRNVKLA